MMSWMQSNDIYVTSTSPTDTSREETASRNGTRVTGSDSDDILNNVYDLLGNSYEWTQEAYLLGERIFRGGLFYGDNYPSRRRCYHDDAVGHRTRGCFTSHILCRVGLRVAKPKLKRQIN